MGASESPALQVPSKLVPRARRAPEQILVELVRGQVESRGPVGAAALAAELALGAGDVEVALASLETEGFVLRGLFSGAAAPGAVEWCERGLLARIYRYTLARLRREIEPVQQTDFMRFLLRWQIAQANIARAIGQQNHQRHHVGVGVRFLAEYLQRHHQPGRQRRFATHGNVNECFLG